MQITYHCGKSVVQSDDHCTIEINFYDSDREIKNALRWSAGRWPESDGEYEGSVWIEDDTGCVLDSERVRITPDGEIDFPG